ncbi:MSHA biogenesis protein MshP [Aeromonas diversa]|uniref:MSHA biogenesis protein MshP n=1 Tax=Aeromonas diversa TaxID=502790 RepID=UPI0034621FA9
MNPRRTHGSALLIALFVIVVMALLAAAMGRFLTDSGEKHTLEVRGVRALMAAQSALEVGLYLLYPQGQWQPLGCPGANLTFTTPGLDGCQAVLSCTPVSSSDGSISVAGVRLSAQGSCGDRQLDSANPDFAVSRTLTVETYGE